MNWLSVSTLSDQLMALGGRGKPRPLGWHFSKEQVKLTFCDGASCQFGRVYTHLGDSPLECL